MDVRQAIDDLRITLDAIPAEDELIAVITDRLAALRQAYPFRRSSFTPRDIEFLKSVGMVSDHLRAFIELKEELAGVSSVKDFQDVVSRLTRAKDSLARFPVARGIAKEVRDLHERLPAIREQDEANRPFRLNRRILNLQQNPRRCRRHHPMVIREGTRGHFRGCSRYPFCSATAQLIPEENELLRA